MPPRPRRRPPEAHPQPTSRSSWPRPPCSLANCLQSHLNSLLSSALVSAPPLARSQSGYRDRTRFAPPATSQCRRRAPTLREKHAEATRRALIRSARTLFALRGYQATSVDQIAAHADATRGTVYHHFQGKRELLLTVFDEMEEALARRIAEAAASETDPLRRLRTAVAVFLDACTEPANTRVLLREAPAVVGWDTWREVDERHFMGLTKGAVQNLISAGEMAPELDGEIVAHLITALLTEAAFLLARDKTPEARTRVDAVVDAFLGGSVREPGPQC